MVKGSYFMLLGTFVCMFALAQNQDKITQDKPIILFVGFHHLDDSLVNVLSPKRQKEVEEVVTRLKKFQPTKIACERSVFENDTLEDRYTKYLRGNYELGGKPEPYVNTKLETYQVGFRLAKELHHEKIYGVDCGWLRPLASLDSFARSQNEEAYLRRFEEVSDEVGKPMEEIIKTSSLLRMLQFLNADTTIPKIDQALLSSYVHIGKDGNYIGTDHLLQWFERNLKIYTNITRIIESNDDRILVLTGAFHVNLLQWFIVGSGEYDLEKAGEYLK